jgi:CubicO group peptidase (beta-lactamase class C family)
MASELGGSVAVGLEAVAEEFERNFDRRSELGAAFAVVRDGDLVVDLWGGLRDGASGAPWEPDTMQLVFSGAKGFVAVCLLLLIERGRLELAAPVARYWPEFGKEDVRVGDVVSHTARLPGVDAPTSARDVLDPGRMAERLAAQAPSADPRACLCYHAFTYGWICGELVRRIDGRRIGEFFAQEVAEPLGLNLWLGLPEELEPRVATLALAPTWPASRPLRPEAHREDALLRSIWGNPPLFERESFPWNDTAFRAAELPAVGAIGTAREIARLYASLAGLLSLKTLELATTTLSSGRDEAHEEDRRFGVGFALQTEARTLGPPDDAFGHSGAGGSAHGCWPSLGIGFSYAMNLMRDEPDDLRSGAVLRALYDATR